MKKLALLLLACLSITCAHAAYLRNIPMTLTQPDGTVLHCFASGDEYFNYLHDANGYTIMPHPKTGYYVYAERRDGQLVATDLVAGLQNPESKGLEPYALITAEEWRARRQAWAEPAKPSKGREYNPNHGTLNNISIFVRFSDDEELSNSYASIDNMFNDISAGAVSMRSYFKAASYGAIEIPTTFYPGHNGDAIISYCDTYPRSYFEPYNSSTNTNGYQDDDDRKEREFSLLERAVNYINDNYPIPTSINIDYDDDDFVDNVCFIVKGGVGAWSSLLWPHKWALYDKEVYINGKRVWTFNFQLADATSYFNTSTMCHEMNHSLSAPDLYHYYNGTNLQPAGPWDLMENNATPPQHCGAYMKMKYGHWIDIPEITQAGTYTLNPISSATPTNIAYKIQSEDPYQYYVLEYRDKTSLFETSLPGSGLLIYRIDTRFEGNADYDPDNGIYDELYLFRPGGSATVNGDLNNAYFNPNVCRDVFSAITSAYPFFTGGSIDYNFNIYNIQTDGNTMSFSYGTSAECEAPTNLTATVTDNSITLSWDAAANAQSYNIYRSGLLVGNTTGTSYTDSNVAYGQYDYFVKSVDANGVTSAASEYISATLVPEGYIFIGSSTSITDNVLPSYSYYNYALTQQIYTAAELGDAGVITGIAFFNGGGEKTRRYDFYMKATNKNTFSNNSDWETVTVSDKVFSGEVTMLANDWTYINFVTPFSYDGSSNVVLVADDNTNNWSAAPHMSCRVFSAPAQTLHVHNDGSNYDPLTAGAISGTEVMDLKNQLLVAKTTATTDPITVSVSASPSTGGTVSGGGEYGFGEICMVSAMPKEGYSFVSWTENDALVSYEPEFSFTVVQERNLVANFEMGIYIGDEGTTTNQTLPSHSFYNYTLSQQIYTADEIGYACTINSISFFNSGTEKTRSYDIYLAHTEKSAFSGSNDWITVSAENKVFSGDVTMSAGNWTTIDLDTPFEYDGTNNLALITDDNTGSYSNGMRCLVFDAPSQAIRIYSDGTNYDPTHPSSYTGEVMNVKNQIKLGIATGGTQTISLSNGWNWVSFNVEITMDDLKAAIVAANPGTAPVIKSKGNGQASYNGAVWVGALKTLDLSEMYEIKVANACNVNLEGARINPTDHPATIKNGINWIAYPLDETMSVATAFEDFPATGDNVKSKDGGQATWNGVMWLGALKNLVPGTGYIYTSTATGDKTFTFPTNK